MVWIYFYWPYIQSCKRGIYRSYDSLRMTHRINTQYDKKIRFKQNQVRGIFSIKVINENQLVRLMIINKEILMRNRNDNRFHSHDSWISRRSRTQSATIPNFANLNLLYIYIKRGLCWFADKTRERVDNGIKRIYIRYINQFFATPIEHTQTQPTEKTGKFTLIRKARCNGWGT